MAQATEFVEFLVWPRNGQMKDAVTARVDLRAPIRLYDETPGSPYRAARARAWKIARRELEQSPSMPMCAEPHDWSDGVDCLSAEQVSA